MPGMHVLGHTLGNFMRVTPCENCYPDCIPAVELVHSRRVHAGDAHNAGIARSRDGLLLGHAVYGNVATGGQAVAPCGEHPHVDRVGCAGLHWAVETLCQLTRLRGIYGDWRSPGGVGVRLYNDLQGSAVAELVFQVSDSTTDISDSTTDISYSTTEVPDSTTNISYPTSDIVF